MSKSDVSDNLKSIAHILESQDNIAIVSHIMPDGDSIGSSMALYCALKRMGKNVTVLGSDSVPHIYSFLPGLEDILYMKGEPMSFDVLVLLDCGSMDRTGQCSRVSGKTTVNIDHHLTNSMNADLSLVDTKASSTGELVYRLIKYMEKDIGQDEALCLYTAILTDTGCFKYSNTTQTTHIIAGDLISTGIDFGFIHDYVYRNFRYESLKLLGKALCSLETHEGGRVGLMYLSSDDLSGFDMRSISTTDFIDYGRDIETIEAVAFLKELFPGEFRVSFRSKNYVDVRAICEKYGGGGHMKAAGCTINGSFEQVKETVLKELKNAIKDDNA